MNFNCKLWSISALPLLLVLAACGTDTASSGSGSGAEETGILGAINSVKSTLDSVGGISSASRKANQFMRKGPISLSSSLITPPNFGGDWTSSSAILDPENYPGETTRVSFKDFFGAQLDPDALTRPHPTPGSGDEHAFNALGRMKNALSILCAVGVGMDLNGTVTDSNGYPTDDSMNFTFTRAFLERMKSDCGFGGEVDSMEGRQLEATVESVTGEYDIKIHFDLFKQDYFYRSNSSEINILTAEQADSSGPTMRTILAYDLSTQVMRVDYASVIGDASSAGLEGHRLYYDAANDDGMLFSVIGQADSDITNKNVFVIAGKPNTGTAYSVSGKFTGYNSHGKYEACVLANGNMSTDGSRCTASATTVVGADVDAPIAGALDDLMDNQTQTNWQSSVTASKTLSWSNKTNMMTGAFY